MGVRGPNSLPLNKRTARLKKASNNKDSISGDQIDLTGSKSLLVLRCCKLPLWELIIYISTIAKEYSWKMFIKAGSHLELEQHSRILLTGG